MRFKIEVKNLGMNNINKTVEVEKIDYDTLYGIVKPHLCSSCIDFLGVVEGEWGTVRVGMWRSVGNIRFSKIVS